MCVMCFEAPLSHVQIHSGLATVDLDVVRCELDGVECGEAGEEQIWMCASGASKHVTHDSDSLNDYRECRGYIPLADVTASFYRRGWTRRLAWQASREHGALTSCCVALSSSRRAALGAAQACRGVWS